MKKFIAICLIIMSILIFSCSKNNNLEIKRVENDSNIYIFEDNNDDNGNVLDFDHETYELVGSKVDNSIELKLLYYDNSKVEELFSTGNINIKKSQKLLLGLSDKRFSVYVLDKGKVLTKMDYSRYDNLSFKDVKSYGWIESSVLDKDKETTLFCLITNDSGMTSPDFKEVNIYDWIEKHKDYSGMFVQVKKSK